MGVILTAVGVTLLVGCAPAAALRCLGIAADDVAYVEYYEYPWVDVPDPIERLTIDDPDILSEWVRAYAGMPVTDVSRSDLDDLAGGADSIHPVRVDGRAEDRDQHRLARAEGRHRAVGGWNRVEDRVGVSRLVRRL